MTTTKYYKVTEVAKILDCTPQTVYRMIRRGVIPGIRLGTIYRVPVDAFDAVCASATPSTD